MCPVGQSQTERRFYLLIPPLSRIGSRMIKPLVVHGVICQRCRVSVHFLLENCVPLSVRMLVEIPISGRFPSPRCPGSWWRRLLAPGMSPPIARTKSVMTRIYRCCFAVVGYGPIRSNATCFHGSVGVCDEIGAG
ncbi:unnamed protein product [Trichogramma brassicae]|uniref:Uncharacterized protein n=1 Tax=Trichogramma brassicae TaxID=86971 RepID=A0A6H5J8V9_9HYME|nr:unnamed protein product [Trichogramma brassicae]